MPRENGDNVGCGEVSKLFAEKFHGNMPQNLSAGEQETVTVSPQKPKLTRSTVSSPKR
jgi:ribosomal protein L27